MDITGRIIYPTAPAEGESHSGVAVVVPAPQAVERGETHLTLLRGAVGREDVIKQENDRQVTKQVARRRALGCATTRQ